MSEHVILTPIYGFYGHFHTGKMMIKLWILRPLFSIKLKCGLPKYLGKIEITTTAEGHIVSEMDNLPLYMGIHHQQNIGMCSLGGMISKHAWNIISFYNMIHVFFLFRFYVNFPWSIWTPQMEDVRRKNNNIFSKGPLTNHGLDSLIRLIAFQIPRHVAGFRWIQSHHQENMQEEHVPRDLGSRKTQ